VTARSIDLPAEDTTSRPDVPETGAGTAAPTDSTSDAAAPEPRWLDAEEQRTWRAFLAASQLFFTQLDRELQRDGGLPHTYYEILVRLSEAPDWRMRMSDLAERSLSSRSRLSHAVARLEQNGWIRRDPCSDDRRGAFAVLTDDGFEVLDHASRGHVEGVRTHLFDQLTADELSTLREVSEKLLHHLAEADPSLAATAADLAPSSCPQE
jgi:DNA-binding MarR family transcriptional regulator